MKETTSERTKPTVYDKTELKHKVADAAIPSAVPHLLDLSVRCRLKTYANEREQLQPVFSDFNLLIQ